MYQIQLIYIESGKKYTFPVEMLEKYVDEKTIAKIKAEALKEIAKGNNG